MRYLIFLLFLLSPLLLNAEAFYSAGFLSGNIWYSKDPFFTRDTVRIYSAVFNSSAEDITGTVEFLDNGASVGTSDFFVEKGGNLDRVWIDWVATGGPHVVEAQITSAKFVLVGGREVAVQLSNMHTPKSERFVSLDTDHDTIADDMDNDDDNDGASDEQEKVFGTDPLKQNSSKELAAALEALKKDNNQFSTWSDSDNDGASDIDERSYGTNPFSSNTTEELDIARQQFTERQAGDDILDKLPLPKPISRVAKNIDSGVEKIVQKPLDAIGRARAELKQKIEQDTKRDNLVSKSYLAALSAVNFILETRFLLYIFALFIIYKTVKYYIRRRKK